MYVFEVPVVKSNGGFIFRFNSETQNLTKEEVMNQVRSSGVDDRSLEFLTWPPVPIEKS